MDFSEQYVGAKAVIYARVSSKEQEKEGFSIPVQRDLLEQYAKDSRHRMVIATEHFVDVETAKSAGRTQFGKMIEYLRLHKDVRHILVEKTDRLYRNFRDFVTIDDLGVIIHLVKENEILSPDSRSNAKLFHGFKVLMAKNYIDNLSEEVRKGMDRKALEGDWPCRAPLGYIRNTVTHKVEVDPETAPKIRRLFESYADGHRSLRQLVHFAGAIGLRTSRGHRLNKAGVHRILGNAFYLGRFTYKGKLFEKASHVPIVNPELFARVQMLLRHPEKARVSKRDFAYRGLMTCFNCGCSMTPDMKMGKYLYYRCTEFRGRCKNSISEPKLSEMLVELIQCIHIPIEVAEGLRQSLLESHQDQVKFHEESHKSLEHQKRTVRERLNQAYEDKLQGLISNEFWKEKCTQWNSDLVQIDAEIVLHREANLNYLQLGNQVITLANKAHEMFVQQDNRQRRVLLDHMVSKIEYADGTLYPTYRKPFDLLVNMAKTRIWRAVSDSLGTCIQSMGQIIEDTILDMVKQIAA